MTITLDSLKRDSKVVATRTYEKDGLKVVIEYDGNEAFERAYQRLSEMDAEEKNESEANLLSKSYNSDDRMTSIERQLFVVGEYLIKDWEGVDAPDGKKAEINGQNFVALCGAVGKNSNDKVEFLTKVFELVAEVMDEIRQKADKIKKKPSRSTNTRKKQAS